MSELLRFYREDFGSEDASLIAFINRYVPHAIPEDFELRFIPYSWTVANSRSARAVAAIRGAQ